MSTILIVRDLKLKLFNDSTVLNVIFKRGLSLNKNRRCFSLHSHFSRHIFVKCVSTDHKYLTRTFHNFKINPKTKFSWQFKTNTNSYRCFNYVFSRDSSSQTLVSSESIKAKKNIFRTEIPPSKYDSENVESLWYKWWDENNFFDPDYSESNDVVVICLPPPNVTGHLHLGHALGCSIQDSFIRYHKMCGKKVLWIPGCDHAGISTQVVVEKYIMRKNNLSRHDIGRDNFFKEVLSWKNEKEDIIYNQMKQLGCALNWKRAVFTLDPRMCLAVNEAFIRLHNEGLIYRDNCLVNWSCSLRSAISDIEVDNIEIKGKTYLKIPGYEKNVCFGLLTDIAYKVVDSGEEVIVSTTRPETMLGDVAIAVHPDDRRYTHLHGSSLWHPFRNVSIPLIIDSSVSQDFGTGAVKITPAHDFKDYDIAKKYELPFILVINDEGQMFNVPSFFYGLKRFEARSKIIEELKKLGLYRGQVEHSMILPLCSRSGDVLEPSLKSQWFLNCFEMNKKAADVVADGGLKIVPQSYVNIWNEWLVHKPYKNWCISRQLWWGHRIPAYRIVSTSGKFEAFWVSAHSESEAHKKAVLKMSHYDHSDIICTQDDDVLDTWFSSSLFPFSSLGWPENTSDFQNYYPITLLETAGDILFFWVAKMVMMGMHLTGHLPFKEILLHGIVRDNLGRKMSKSLGNVIDPMDIIKGASLSKLKDSVISSNLSKNEINIALKEKQKLFPRGMKKCGADSLRFTLCNYNIKSHFINMNVDHLESNVKFCNKVWQAYRFCYQQWIKHDYTHLLTLEPTDLTYTDKWILSRLSELVVLSHKSFSSYNLNHITDFILNFWRNDFCGIYIEYCKYIFQNESNLTNQSLIMLYDCFHVFLHVLAPFMPFLSEELYQRVCLFNENAFEESIMSSFPSFERYNTLIDNDLNKEMQLVKDVVSNILSLQLKLDKSKLFDVVIACPSEELFLTMNRYNFVLKALCKKSNIDLILKNDIGVHYFADFEHVTCDIDDYSIYMKYANI